MDEGTRRVVQAAIDFSAAGVHTLKGKAEPVSLWRAVRVLSGVGGSQRVDGLEAPFVGRDAELRLVKEMFHACVERRSPRLVSVTGLAGVGKSRLGWEFEKYIDGLADTVWWHRGRCLSYGDGVAFWALAEMVRQRLQIADDDPSSVAAGKLTTGLNRWLPDAAERDLRRPSVGSAARCRLRRGGSCAGPGRAVRRVAIVLRTPRRAGTGGAGDRGFAACRLRAAGLRGAPVGLGARRRGIRAHLGPARAGVPPDRLGAGRRNTTTLSLDPLDDTAMAVLLDGLVPGMPVAAKTAIADRAEGIPLYAVETVRMLIDRDVVQPVEGVYRLVW
ncbi:MAG: ATP-binding protein [Nocardioidaceae bacterium]